MNVILIEPDCSQYWQDPEAVSARIGDVPCRVQSLQPDELPTLEQGCRCVVLSSFRNGVAAHHHALVTANPQVRCWLFTAAGTFLPGEQRQLMDSLEQVMADTDARYSMVFDAPDALTATALQCSMPIPQRRCWLVVSNNHLTALWCRSIFSRLLPSWDVIAETSQPEAAYLPADVILAVGAAAEDFTLPPPPFGLGRTYAWLEQPKTAAIDTASVYRSLTSCGWELASKEHIFCSDPQLEEYALRLQLGETTPLALANEDSFILCDEYQLPLRPSDYTEERICSYLNQKCCLGALAKRFQ